MNERNEHLQEPFGVRFATDLGIRLDICQAFVHQAVATGKVMRHIFRPGARTVSPRVNSLPRPQRQKNQLVRARMMSARPTRKHPNIAAINLKVPSGASRNSFQMKTPQNAAIIVAPWPSP
jgi:hypothetical protein